MTKCQITVQKAIPVGRTFYSCRMELSIYKWIKSNEQ